MVICFCGIITQSCVADRERLIRISLGAERLHTLQYIDIVYIFIGTRTIDKRLSYAYILNFHEHRKGHSFSLPMTL